MIADDKFEALLEQADAYDEEAEKLLSEGKVDEANKILDLRDDIEAQIEKYCESINVRKLP